MRDRDLYARILGIEAPWRVTGVELDDVGQVVNVGVEHHGELKCPRCGKSLARYDTRQRRWRHLDTCQYHPYLVADVPRVECGEDGVLQIEVPWAEAGSRLTAFYVGLGV